jgi:hypothetical protein
MTRIDHAINHLERAERWVTQYERTKTLTSRIILEHYIKLTRFHVDEAHKEKNGIQKEEDEDDCLYLYLMI